MTKEQEEAIKVLEQYKHECIEEYKVELDDKKYTDEQHASYLHQQIEAVHIVLSMLKEKDKEIKTLTQTNKSYKGIINKKDRQIDLMARAFKQDDVRTVEEIKQYFERKAKDGRN